MASVAADRSLAVLQSIGIHVLFGLIMIFGLSYSSEKIAPVIPVTIQATVVDRQDILDARERQREAEQQKLRDAAAERRRQQQEQERQQQAERERQAEEERRRQQAAERRREQDEARERAMDMERQRQAELQRQQEEIRRQREALAQEREKQQQQLEEAQRQSQLQEQARQQRLEEERRKQLLYAEQQQLASAEAATLEQEWIALVRSQVTANWRRPPTAREGLRCLVQVHQAPGGQVLDVALLPGCNGDEATRRSIVNAVWRSDPLPYRGYEQVLKRQFKFEFVY